MAELGNGRRYVVVSTGPSTGTIFVRMVAAVTRQEALERARAANPSHKIVGVSDYLRAVGASRVFAVTLETNPRFTIGGSLNSV